MAAATVEGRTREAPGFADALLALGLAAFAQLDLRFDLDNSTRHGPAFASAVVVAVATLALAWRRRWPFATVCVVATAVAGPELFTTLTFTLWGHFLPLLVAAFTAARWCSDRYAAASVAVVSAALAVVLLRVPEVHTLGNVPFALVPAAGVMVAGRVLRRREQRLTELETTRERDLAEALAQERSRIARELHDVVAHCVSVMVVQAGAAEALLDRSPDAARAPLRAVQETGQQAIGELRRLLGLLREQPGASSDLAPQPGVAQLTELAERLSGSGLDVRVTTSGEVRPLPPGVDLTAYRIVQEALTNVLKHAGPGTTAHVDLGYGVHRLDVEVVDDGPLPASTTAAFARGNGLVGMTERAQVFGGSLEAAPLPGGGFRVAASLPLEAT
jgi:signal transduction histidine kinase